MHREGAQLAFTCAPDPRDRPLRNLQKLLEDTLGPAGSFLIQACDVRDDEQVGQAFAAIGEQWGGLDALAHCIAFGGREDLSRPFSEVSRDGFKTAVEVSGYSLQTVARAAKPLMENAGGGSILTLTYNAVNRVVPGYSVMAEAKAVLETAVRYLAAELGPSGIRVNAISAGPVNTLSARAVRGIRELLSWSEDHAPMRTNVTPIDIGDTAVYLVSDLSRRVTGNIIFVDSGSHILGPVVVAD
jgi:enoyl-[acyl-carrier protein] reductase I